MYAGVKEVSQQARDGVKEVLQTIDGFLSNSKWIAGENLTIADFSCITIVCTVAACGYDLTQHQNVLRWFKQCHSLPGFEENLKGAEGLGERLKSLVEGTIF